MGNLQAQRAVDMPGHRAEGARLAEVLTLLKLDVVTEPAQVRAGVGKQYTAGRQHPAHCLCKLAGVNVPVALGNRPRLPVLGRPPA